MWQKAISKIIFDIKNYFKTVRRSKALFEMKNFSVTRVETEAEDNNQHDFGTL